ncbi:hypothetical protein ACIGZJ_34620 [Kitasatospora sp. NPDC052868]|uniref:hypothetical protein n=1 Tax=Kitasatospora sp. NPDC052868 TaxID=3364060 RepID=UPI0037C6FB26
MGEQAEPPRPQVRPITAQVTVTGLEAAVLCELAGVLGRSPEALALEYAAGTLKLPTSSIGESEFADWALFDGPPDLATHADEHLAEGFGR